MTRFCVCKFIAYIYELNMRVMSKLAIKGLVVPLIFF